MIALEKIILSTQNLFLEVDKELGPVKKIEKAVTEHVLL